MKRIFFWLLCAALAIPTLAIATEPERCGQVRFSDVGWTDITVTTAMTRLILSKLGYATEVKRMSVPDTYKALGEKRLDVFMGNWMPSMAADLKPYQDAGSVESLPLANLEGAKYTLAVNRAAYEGGVRSFADLARFKEQLGGTLYGIEPGNDGNQLIRKMIDSDAFGLKGFTLAESSENGMLAKVMHAQRMNKWIVFLGWEPHPMNTRFEMNYLEGGDEFFGPDYGGASVFTNVRAGYLQECPNVARLLGNLRFSLAMENQLMDEVLSGRKNRREAALDWLKENPQVLALWLEGVKRRDGSVPEAGLGLERIQ
ncbi:choline ABC transporter substrate-binding protein [Pseudomonas sp. LRF_L74]|uniref:choline ABC transporter substrate-binding protein n=1 Tax=Pseudomonas sp. LRF_L74 TaxID=3369422 RepID=UPI003F61DC61